MSTYPAADGEEEEDLDRRTKQLEAELAEIRRRLAEVCDDTGQQDEE